MGYRPPPAAPWLILTPGWLFGARFYSQVGCYYAWPPKDKPPWRAGSIALAEWHGHYTSNVIAYDCRGARMGDMLVGFGNIQGIKLIVEQRYEEAKATVHERIKAFNTFVDVRTLEMLDSHCCPHQLIP